MAKTKIEWTDYTFNPWWGCTKVSSACDHCYAEGFAKRTGFKVWGKDVPRRLLGDRYWKEPLLWNRQAKKNGIRKKVFCGSMCDVMEWPLESLIESFHRPKLWPLIEDTPFLDWMLLTKRPQNFARLLPQRWLEKPLPNLWLLTTVESPAYTWRIDKLLKVPAVLHGVSYEPALEPVDFSPHLDLTTEEFCENWRISEWKPVTPEDTRRRFPKLNWIIAGGESGPKARPSHPDWFRSVRDQCQAAGVPYFFKQWGEWSAAGQVGGPPCDGKWHEWADGTISVRIGKKAAGRLLDGRTWDEMPGGLR